MINEQHTHWFSKTINLKQTIMNENKVKTSQFGCFDDKQNNTALYSYVGNEINHTLKE